MHNMINYAFKEDCDAIRWEAELFEIITNIPRFDAMVVMRISCLKVDKKNYL